MKKLFIKYNPYHLKTEILVDGKKPKLNSKLHFRKLRLQEWAELLPEILVDECNERDFDITFVGTVSDFSDLRSVLSENSQIRCKFEIKEQPSITAVEKEILAIFDDIKKGPVQDLRDASIIEAFESARNQEFEINVVATMSSGKSTLINALLGKDIMPRAQEATTSKIVRVTHTNQENIHAIAYNAHDEKVGEEMDIDYERMKLWNNNPQITSIQLYCPIPCVKSIGMRLVILDTPGPNNAHDERHKAVTYGMLNNSPMSLVLFVLNKEQSGVNDEKNLISYVAETMAKGGKLSRERFLFAINRMDTCDPRRDNIEEDLKHINERLETYGISVPNLFPVAALPALQVRADDDFPGELQTFKMKAAKFPSMKLEQYYSYNHLPSSVKKDLELWTTGKSVDEAIEIHTGIVSIEQAIRMYVDKYARPLKVRDLVDAFNNRLTSLNSIAELEKKIRENQEFKEELVSKIAAVKARIADGKQAEQLAKDIEEINLAKSVMEEIMDYLGQASGAVRNMRRKYGDKKTEVVKKQALSQVETIKKESLDLLSKLDARISNILEEGHKKLYSDIVSQFKRSLEDLSIAMSDSEFCLKPIDFVAEELAELNSIIDKKTKKKDIGDKERMIDNPNKHWYNPFTWFSPSKIKSPETKWESFVNMEDVIDEYLTPIQEQLLEARKAAENHIYEESARIKSNLLSKIEIISQLIQDRLTELSSLNASHDATAEQILAQESNLEWMRSIKRRVDNLIEY